MLLKKQIRRGFTLIEVLAATGIMAVVILVVLSLTTNVLTHWNRSTGKLSSNYEARVALDILANDLESLVMRNRPFCWIQVDYVEPDHGSISYANAIPEMPQMYFMARVEDRPRFTSDDDDGDGQPDPIYGDICTVAYRLIYQNPLDPGANNPEDLPIFGLYRFVIDSFFTFQYVMDTGDSDSNGQPDPLDKLAPQMLTSKYRDENGDEQDVEADTISQDENFLSANIVNLRAVFWYTDPTESDPANQLKAITSTEDASGDPISFTYTNRLNIDGRGAVPGTLEYVDISVTVMSPEGLAIMESESIDTNDWDEVVAQYGTTFSRRVHIMAKPL